MTKPTRFTFKIASEAEEFEQIHQLNHRSFAEEIPQHPPRADGRLVDRFHHENTYVICLEHGVLRGMMALRCNRPFSLDSKLVDLDGYLPPHRSACEVRLLAIDAIRRHGSVLGGLARLALGWAGSRGCDLAVMSGTVRQARLYGHLGFRPFGPLVGTEEARYQPMYARLEALECMAQALLEGTPPVQRTVNLLPGPVSVRPAVWDAFNRPPLSHRSEAFVAAYDDTLARLRQLVNARDVALMLGSGTLANDAVAAQLAGLGTPGLVLTNGEFGDRLVDHASRAGLTFRSVAAPWGCPFDAAALERAIGTGPAAWVWAVHCETSTGVLIDLQGLKSLCEASGALLCLDAISSIGMLAVDLAGVHLATGVSGKGIGGLPGVSMVFHEHAIAPSARIPRYLDIGLYGGTPGVPFTHSSNLVVALRAAVEYQPDDAEYARRAALSRWLRGRLREEGFEVVAPEDSASPAVITLALPAPVSSSRVGRLMGERWYLLSYESAYLLKRNWIQICLMTPQPRRILGHLVRVLGDCAGGANTCIADGGVLR